MAPEAKEIFLSGTTKSVSNLSSFPSPSQRGHAPCGLLNENNLGSISGMLKPDIGQENLSEKIIFSLGFSDASIDASPSASLNAVSRLSASLDSIPFFTTTLSTTISMSCFIFLSSSGAFSNV